MKYAVMTQSEMYRCVEVIPYGSVDYYNPDNRCDVGAANDVMCCGKSGTSTRIYTKVYNELHVWCTEFESDENFTSEIFSFMRDVREMRQKLIVRDINEAIEVMVAL